MKFYKIDVFIKTSERNRYLVLFGPERYDAIYDSNGYLIIEVKWCYI